MTALATWKEFNAWAAHRLAEMDAGLAAMEAEVATARGLDVDAARLWRDRFAVRIGLADHADGQAHYRDAIPALRESWAQFEIAMENWAVAAEKKNAAFDARARIEAAIARLERDAAAYSEKFEDLTDVG